MHRTAACSHCPLDLARHSPGRTGPCRARCQVTRGDLLHPFRYHSVPNRLSISSSPLLPLRLKAPAGQFVAASESRWSAWGVADSAVERRHPLRLGGGTVIRAPTLYGAPVLIQPIRSCTACKHRHQTVPPGLAPRARRTRAVRQVRRSLTAIPAVLGRPAPRRTADPLVVRLPVRRPVSRRSTNHPPSRGV